MEKANIADIILDEEDAKLLKIKSDLLLKAKGIRYSILPQLNIILEEALSRIRKVYGIEVFNENSAITSAPGFREKRDNELKKNYDYAFIGITGSRAPIWKGFSRKDGKPVKIIGYCLGFTFTEDGISMFFSPASNLHLTDESHIKYFDFIKSNMSYIQTIQLLSQMEPELFFWKDDENVIIPFEQYLNKLINNKFFELSFHRKIKFPIGQIELNVLIRSFVIFYPIYDSVIRIAKGEEPIFNKLISMLNYRDIDIEHLCDKTNEKIIISEENENILSKAVDNTNTVRAGIRWQVFERDDFKCVACGSSAIDGAILHVDHITPRSKGGKDEMENYQTLCHKCNIGKSNKSQVNLRIEK